MRRIIGRYLERHCIPTLYGKSKTRGKRLANSEHISLVRSGASAIATWREVNYMIPNPSKDEFKLSYRLEDRATHETVRPEFVPGRAKLA